MGSTDEVTRLSILPGVGLGVGVRGWGGKEGEEGKFILLSKVEYRSTFYLEDCLNRTYSFLCENRGF